MFVDEDNYVVTSGFGPLPALAHRLPRPYVNGPYHAVGTHPHLDAVAAYFDDDTTALSRIPSRQTGSNFQRAAWDAIARIPYGSTQTYQQLAAAAGNPRAVRAAGTICGRNRLVLLVPCHRIIKSDGSIGSYLYGPDLKTKLLTLEGAISPTPTSVPLSVGQ